MITEPPVAGGGVGAEPTGGFYSPRELLYIQPAGRRLSDYEAAICHAQPDFGQYDSGAWYLLSPEGRGIFDEATTALRHPDWFEYRDPSSLWQRTYVRQQAEQERAIANLLETGKSVGSFADIDPDWACDVLAPYYEAFACVEWGLFVASMRGVREALSDTLTMTLVFAAVDRLRHQQAITLFSLDLEDEVVGYRAGLGRAVWLDDTALQPARRVVEGLMATADWGQVAVVTSLLFDPLFGRFVLSRFLRRVAPLRGDILTPSVILTAERDRGRHLQAMLALVRLLLAEQDRRGRPVPAGHNREVLQAWVCEWTPLILDAVEAFIPVVEKHSGGRDLASEARAEAVDRCARLLGDLGLELPVAASP